MPARNPPRRIRRAATGRVTGQHVEKILKQYNIQAHQHECAGIANVANSSNRDIRAVEGDDHSKAAKAFALVDRRVQNLLKEQNELSEKIISEHELSASDRFRIRRGDPTLRDAARILGGSIRAYFYLPPSGEPSWAHPARMIWQEVRRVLRAHDRQRGATKITHALLLQLGYTADKQQMTLAALRKQIRKFSDRATIAGRR